MDKCPCKNQFTCCTILSKPNTSEKIDPISKPESAEVRPEPTEHFHCGEKLDIIGPRLESNDDTNLFVARTSEFPWTIAVFKKEPTEELTFICGASLVGQRVAVTANHNVVNDSKYIIRAGSLTLHLEDEPFLIPQDRSVTKVIFFNLIVNLYLI